MHVESDTFGTMEHELEQDPSCSTSPFSAEHSRKSEFLTDDENGEKRREKRRERERIFLPFWRDVSFLLFESEMETRGHELDRRPRPVS